MNLRLNGEVGRIVSALVLIPVAVWIALFPPQSFFYLPLAIVGLAAFREFDKLAAAQGVAPSGILGLAGGLILLLAPEPALPVLIVIALGLMAMNLRLGDLSKALASAATSVLGMVYIFGAARCAAGLREINPHWLMIAMLVCWAGDTVALYVGRAFGRHPLAPVVSPKKTWEGAIGSVIGGTAAAGIYAHFFIPAAPLWAVLATGAGANIAGQFGDLCESAWKRGAHVKDSGASLPGHGGWLDRLDSSLFSIPVVYGILKLTFAYPWF